MEQITNHLKSIRARLGKFRKEGLKETSTRTIIIDPLLEALSWDVRDPDIVQLEYTTIDGKFVDYALKINNKPVLLVEAKPLNDPLNDVKWITQVVGYAANAGIDWCILTNGVSWKIYKSTEKCPAPDKLLFEINFDPKKVKDEDLDYIAKKFKKLSRDEIAEGTLDREGERIFNDSKVKKALDAIMQNPPRSFINLLKREMQEASLLDNKKIKESLYRIWVSKEPPRNISKPKLNVNVPKKKGFDESYHLSVMSPDVIELYRKIDNFCMNLNPGEIEKKIRQMTINYLFNKRIFCCLHGQKSKLKLFINLNYSNIQSPPNFVRDVNNIGHWGTGDVEIALSNASQLPETFELIRQAFNKV
jgi:hypothetical protein